MTAVATETVPRFVPTAGAVMPQARVENFPVAMRLLGSRRRAHLLALYGFARLVDDAGDEADGDRLALLDWIEGDLDRIYAGHAPEHPLLRALAPTVRALRLPAEPFRALIEANRIDQRVARYETWEQLLAYCRLSAAPVGELVLHVLGAATPDRVELSDGICVALQLTEHIQDVAEDRARGRVYLPQRDLERFGCADEDLRTPGSALSAVIAFEVDRARALLAQGAPLVRRLPPTGSVAVAGFIAGGRAALDAVARSGFDVVGARPRPTRRGFARALLITLARPTWR